jgi:hypothetical protein
MATMILRHSQQLEEAIFQEHMATMTRPPLPIMGWMKKKRETGMADMTMDRNMATAS